MQAVFHTLLGLINPGRQHGKCRQAENVNTATITADPVVLGVLVVGARSYFSVRKFAHATLEKVLYLRAGLAALLFHTGAAQQLWCHQQ